MGVIDSDKAARVLAALARGVLGDAHVAGVPAHMVDTIGNVASRSDREQLLRTLALLDSRLGALALTGRAGPVSWLTPTEAEHVVSHWKASRLRALRDLASTVISLAVAAAYGRATEAWDAISYPGPLGPAPDIPKTLEPVEVDADEVLECDVVVVGSGAGGGCVAGELATRGFDVVVVEKGAYHSESDFTHIEPEAFRDMYLYGGILTTTDLGVRILAGSTLGGGTVVNWSTSWKTPEPVLREWTAVSGIGAFADGEIDDSLDEVCERLAVNLDSSAASRRDELMEEGCKKLGWHVDLMPRNVRGCTQDEQCGYCPYGCRIGAKQSSLLTYLQDAGAHGARFIVGADVRKVIVRDGRAEGIEAVRNGRRFTVRARAVVAAGGSIETPALLLRSGLGGRVGYNLRLHPGTAVAGIFPDEVRMWEGTMQARYCDELKGPWDGEYGATLETGPIHPGSWATAVPWISSGQHLKLMQRYAHTSLTAVLSRDTAQGRVTIDKWGSPRVEYKVNADDERRIAEGVIAAGKVMEAAGAEFIYSLHKSYICYRPDTPGDSFERWAHDTRQAGYRNGQVTFASFHQMGSCAMGVDPSSSAVGPDNESHEVRDLFVADASTFPTPSGVNPMISIYGIAHRAAQKIAARLG